MNFLDDAEVVFESLDPSEVDPPMDNDGTTAKMANTWRCDLSRSIKVCRMSGRDNARCMTDARSEALSYSDMMREEWTNRTTRLRFRPKRRSSKEKGAKKAGGDENEHPRDFRIRNNRLSIETNKITNKHSTILNSQTNNTSKKSASIGAKESEPN